MTLAPFPPIVLEHGGPQPTVVEGAGWVQTTPAGRSDRTYRDLLPDCPLAPATDVEFLSLTAMLGRGIPSDWTGPAKWNVARGAVADWQRLAQLGEDDRVREMVTFADSSLNAAADRGSAIHRAMESLLAGSPVDRDDLRANGALPYLLAVERFVADANPQAVLVEAPCFDRALGVAGTVDFVGTTGHTDGIYVLDWKTRTKGHERREKEAAQVAAYAHMIGEHYYIDDRGTRRRLAVDGAAVVTLAPDGTWALHPVDLAAGVDHYCRAVDMARQNKVSALYGPAIKADAPDVNALARGRLARIPDGTPARATLAATWGLLGLGAPSRNELTIEDWPTADEALATAERGIAPFPQPRETPTTYAGADEVAEVGAEWSALPPDVRARLEQASGPLFRRFNSGIVTADDLEDVDRWIGSVADEVACRRAAVDAVLAGIEECGDLERAALRAALPNLPAPGAWTESDIDAVSLLWGALDDGDLVVRDGALWPSVHATETLAGAGKRDATTAARPHAKTFGRPAPRKWDDLVADPLLFAAVVAAQSTPTTPTPRTEP